MENLLPILNRDTIRSIDIARERQGTAAYMFAIYKRMAIANPYLTGYIAGYLASSLGVREERLSDERLLQELEDQFQQETEFAKALSGACLLYRLLESQAEADWMKKDL